MLLYLILALFSCTTSWLYGEEIFDSSKEAATLKNIKQITFASMGFEKAGEAYFSPDGENIAFQGVPKGAKEYQIYVMNIQEGIPRMVSTGIGACTCAYFRPDGKKIIFASSHSDPMLANPVGLLTFPGYRKNGSDYTWELTPYMNIYEANLDGSELKALTFGSDYHAECAYSADGSRIVFASNKNGTMNLYTMKTDGSDERQITFTNYSYNGGPFFSPNGKQIIFRADRETQHYLQIYVIDSDGQNERQLTDNQAVNWAPYWHPNGKVVVFTTSLHGHKHYEIYGLNLETGKCYRITHNENFDGLPSFSNDGKKLMWTSKRGLDGSCQVFIAEFTLPTELF